MAWYRTGTVNVSNGSTTVIGVGTGFVANSRVGDAFIGPDGKNYEITNVASDTAISIQPEYAGSTLNGQTYAIMPVQGYTKKLADEAAELINEFGQLGDLGTAASLDAVTSNSDATADRLLKVGALFAQLGPDVYGRANILGTVSQSAGVPTGSIIQRGSNANGEFARFADGTQICTRSYTESSPVNVAEGAIYRTNSLSWSFPANFINTNVTVLGSFPNAGAWASPRTNNTSVISFVWQAAPSISANNIAHLFAIGRWY